jgi:hypothetical protein
LLATAVTDDEGIDRAVVVALSTRMFPLAPLAPSTGAVSIPENATRVTLPPLAVANV